MEIINNAQPDYRKNEQVSRGVDVLSKTVEKRQELLHFLNEWLSPQAKVWARDIVNKMNRLFVSGEPKKYMQVKCFYDNAMTFFNEYVTELDASSIICTLYVCAIQLGISSFGDEIESSQEFQDGIDADDWSLVDDNVLRDFDLNMAVTIILNKFCNGKTDLSAAGLFTMQLIDYIS